MRIDWRRLVKAQRPDVDRDIVLRMTQFSLSARVSSNPEKKRTIANVIGSEEGYYCMCGNGEKECMAQYSSRLFSLLYAFGLYT
jgi:hypothetical protein